GVNASTDRHEDVLVEQVGLDLLDQLLALLRVERGVVLRHSIIDFRDAQTRERAFAHRILPNPAGRVAWRAGELEDQPLYAVRARLQLLVKGAPLHRVDLRFDVDQAQLSGDPLAPGGPWRKWGDRRNVEAVAHPGLDHQLPGLVEVGRRHRARDSSLPVFGNPI